MKNKRSYYSITGNGFTNEEIGNADDVNQKSIDRYRNVTFFLAIKQFSRNKRENNNKRNHTKQK